MITVVPDLPGHVVIAEAHGTVRADDYEKVLIPAVEAAAAHGRRLRMLYVLGSDFDGFEAEAAFDDSKLGLAHWRDFDRIGVVTDHESYRLMAKAIGFLMPGEVRVFRTEEVDDARAWITAE
jgi:hypothetical protein